MTRTLYPQAPRLPRFTAILDDVYRYERYLETVGDSRPVSSHDIKVQLGLAQVFGDTLVAPARYIVDHGPLIALCQSPRWKSLAFHLISPAAEESNWEEFLANCGGTESERPLQMSSDADGSKNRLISDAWNGGRGWRESGDLWKCSFPDAVWLIEELRAADVRIRPLGARAPYGKFLRDRLTCVPGARRTIRRLGQQGGRYDALQLIFEASDRLSARTRANLALAAVSAKHDETLSRLPEVASIGIPLHVTGIIPASTVATEANLAGEVPALGALLNASCGAEALEAVYENSPFAEAQARWMALRRSGVSSEVAEFESRFRTLCEEASVALGSRDSASRAEFAIALGSSALLESVGEPTTWQFGLAVVGVTLLAAGSARADRRAWRLLHFDRSLAADLMRASRGRY